MNKVIIGLIFILAGVCYGSLSVDDFYNWTLGWLVKNEWIKPPVPDKKSLSSLLGRRPTILLYAGILIIIGLFIIWNRNS